MEQQYERIEQLIRKYFSEAYAKTIIEELDSFSRQIGDFYNSHNPIFCQISQKNDKMQLEIVFHDRNLIVDFTHDGTNMLITTVPTSKVLLVSFSKANEKARMLIKSLNEHWLGYVTSTQQDTDNLSKFNNYILNVLNRG